MRALPQILRIEDGDMPSIMLNAHAPYLILDRAGGNMLVAELTPANASYLRRLATEADRFADAIDARLAESTAGETRDVPTPGAAT